MAWLGGRSSRCKCTGPTREELMEDLRSALAEALEMNRADRLS